MDGTFILAVAVLFIAVVMLFAQLKLFSIDRNLQAIRDHIERPTEPTESTSEDNPTSMLKL